MQKFLLIIMLLSGLKVQSQMPLDGNYSNWNWEDQSQSNWRSKYGNTWIDINPPFAPTTERLGLMVQIHESFDYTKAKGWQLLWAQFDGDYPYFILYNPHKAIIRAFFYLENVPFTDVLSTLSFYDVTNPGVLSFGDEYQTSTEDYFNNTTDSDNDMLSVIIRNVGVKNWGAADFPILYDNNITNSKFSSKKWKFQFYGCNNYSIHLKGTSTTDPAQLEQHTISASKSAVSSNSFNAQYSKLHKEIQSTDKFLQDMQNSVKNIDTNSAQFLINYKKVVTGIKGVSQTVSAVAGVSSAVGAIASFFRIISGAFNNTETTKPAAVTEFLELEGTMTINQALGGTTLSIPGTSGTYYPPNLSWQPFDCPMGTINLQKTPNIKVTTSYEKYGYYQPGIIYGWQNDQLVYLYYISGFPSPLLAGGSHPVVTSYSKKYPGKFKKYKFDDDIVLARQELSGLTLIDVNFAIVCKANGSGDRKYKMQDKYIAYNKFYNLSGTEFHVPLENPVYKALVENRFIVHKFDEENDEVYFGTPYMSKNKLKGVVLEVPEDTDVKLAVLAKFTSDKYSAPLIFKALYNLSPVTETAQTNKVFFSMEQMSLPFSDFYNTPTFLYLNSSNNSQNSAFILELRPGFVGNTGFIGESLPLTKGLENGNTVINTTNFYCNTTLKNTEEIMGKDLLIQNKDETPMFYPNPNNGVFNIEFKNVLTNTPIIRITNSNGQLIRIVNSVQNTNRVEIDLSNYGKGLYFIQIQDDNETIVKKIIYQ